MDYWPISIFLLRQPPNLDYPNLAHILVAVLSFIVLCVALVIFSRMGYRVWLVALVGFLLIIGTNLAHGLQFGLVRPIAGLGQSPAPYYDDALTIDSPWSFLGEYQDIQLELGMHSITHPPGPILLFYFLARLFPSPIMISVIMVLVSVLLVVAVMAPMLATEFSKPLVGYILLIFLLMPSVQAFYATSIDSLIAGLFIGSFILFFIQSRWAILISLVCIIMASFLTYLALFIPAVMLGYELWVHRRVSRTTIAVIGVSIFYIALYVVSGFNYLESFSVASTWENSEGFLLLANPKNYIMTRVEDIAEIVLFFGPFLTLFFLEGLRRRGHDGKLLRLAQVAMIVFILMLLVGVYRTGETARGALYFYPFLIIPVAYALNWRKDFSNREWAVLAILVFAQTLVMQLVGDYFW
ncbi:MAG: hypothetical protein GTO18_19030 [Anaerolineales bacterium]|nr:hypothetical protein [Anaerolineales bacterium]